LTELLVCRSMTCIVGIAHKGKVWIGGDSIGIAGLDQTPRSDAKVFTRGEFAFGFTSSFRMGQILRYSLKLPSIPDGKDLYEYMVTDFINAVRKCLKAGGYARKESEEESGGTFLVGVRGRLFKICSDYQVGESLRSYESVGCGESYALGSLHGQSSLSNPKKAIVKALEAATEFSAGVKPPYVVVCADPARRQVRIPKMDEPDPWRSPLLR
jgi:hypothetical protein